MSILGSGAHFRPHMQSCRSKKCKSSVQSYLFCISSFLLDESWYGFDFLSLLTLSLAISGCINSDIEIAAGCFSWNLFYGMHRVAEIFSDTNSFWKLWRRIVLPFKIVCILSVCGKGSGKLKNHVYLTISKIPLRVCFLFLPFWHIFQVFW